MSGLHELPDDAAAASTAKGRPAGKRVLARTIEKGLVSPCAFLLKSTLALGCKISSESFDTVDSFQKLHPVKISRPAHVILSRMWLKGISVSPVSLIRHPAIG